MTEIDFADLGISILYIKPQEKDPDLFTFLNPLSPTVWLCIISAYILVSISLCLLAKINHFPNQSDDLSLEGDDMGPRNQVWSQELIFSHKHTGFTAQCIDKEKDKEKLILSVSDLVQPVLYQ